MTEKLFPSPDKKISEPNFPPEYDPNIDNSDISKLYALIKEQEPKEADAIVWLEGDLEDRALKCIKLLQSNYAPLVVLSGGNENAIKATEIQEKFIQSDISENKIILETESQNTKEQAINVLKIAREKEWKKILLVANFYHQFRAFLTFLAELKKEKMDDDVEIINCPAEYGWYRQSPQHNKEEVDALVEEEIPRMIKYAENGDVSFPADGIEYLEKWKKKL